MLGPVNLVEHFGADEFCAFDELHLQRALTRAADTVTRYIPNRPDPACDFGQAVMRAELVLARAYAHDEQAFADDHPVVREMREIIDWLKRVADGRVSVPCVDAPLPVRRHQARVAAPCAVFVPDLTRRML